MLPLRIVLLTGLVICYVSQIITLVDARASPQTILGGLLRSKGKIKDTVNQELANTVDNIADKGKDIVDKLKNRLNIFGRPSEEKPSDSSVAHPLSGIRKWINDRLIINNDTSSSIFGIIIFNRPKKDPSSTTAAPTTTRTSTTMKPTMNTSTEIRASTTAKLSATTEIPATTKSPATTTTASTTTSTTELITTSTNKPTSP